MTIPDEANMLPDDLFNIPHKTVRLRRWLESRLRQLAIEQRIQDARELRAEFLLE